MTPVTVLRVVSTERDLQLLLASLGDPAGSDDPYYALLSVGDLFA